MLSTQYRLKLEGICNKIVLGEEVSLEDMIWAEKLAKANSSAGTMLRQARRRAENPDMKEGDLDDFMNQLDLGGLDTKDLVVVDLIVLMTYTIGSSVMMMMNGEEGIDLKK
jgi:hypothetical protein